MSGVSNDRPVGNRLHVVVNDDTNLQVEGAKMSVSTRDTVVSTWTPSSTPEGREGSNVAYNARAPDHRERKRNLRRVRMLRRAYQPSSASQVERRVFPSNTSTKQAAPARRFRHRQYVQLRTRTCLSVACVLTNQTGTHGDTNDEDGDADNRPEDAGKPGEEAIGNGIPCEILGEATGQAAS